MKLHLLFIGNKFIYNKSLKDYIIRRVETKTDFINQITFYEENDNTLFLYLQSVIDSVEKLIIITTKQNFSTVGKLISTITKDHQIVKEGMLIPSNSSIYEKGSYLLEYEKCFINVLYADEMNKLPDILIENLSTMAEVHIFDEDIESVNILLMPLSQTYDVVLNISIVVDGWLKVNISSKKYGNLSKFVNSAKQLLDTKLIATNNIIAYIINRLSHNEKKITFAESCTGGLLTYYFTKENGASKILDGSLITYSNELKENWLAVDESVLKEKGAVSFDCVKHMSDGALNVSNADYALSVSGIAGDGGGTDDKPVGTVFIGVRTQDKHDEEHLVFNGDRNYVQHQSALYAIKKLLLIDKKIFF